MNFFKHGKTIINLDSIAYCEINDSEKNNISVNISFIGDGSESDWGLTLYGDAALALIEDIFNRAS